MALGAPLLAGVGAIYGYFIATEVARPTGSSIAFAISWAATAAVTGGLTLAAGVLLYLAGAQQLDEAVALAATATADAWAPEPSPPALAWRF